MYTLLNDELLPFEELDAPDLYFQYYPTIYTDSRKGSLVPFSLRLVHAESLRFTPYPWAATKRIDALEMNVQKVYLLSRMMSVCDPKCFKQFDTQVIRNLKEKQTTNAQHLDLWKQRLLSVQKIRARTLFFLKEYGTSMSLYGRIASQEENESHRLAIRLMLARMALSIGSEKEAERYFKEVTQLDEDEILVYKSLKCIFNGNYSQAYEHLQRISKTVQSNAKIRNNTAVCLLYIGKPLDALKILNDQHSTNGNGSDVVPNEPICINSVNIAELATCAIKQYKVSN
ncbi:unnamed protein product [Anisakis simplex]|uniref:TPR_REGION domain-containing protein n=1 Tax=Anisakis simplex TaxID=6269 RepID=A0A0M3JUX6_ANISI|nr:unnamed protein product [Anisakis simplex]